MASLINSVRSITGDPWWIVKIACLSAALFYVMYNAYDYPDGDQRILALYSILGVVLLGCVSVAMNRNVNNKQPLLPSLLSIPEVILRSVCASIAILPGLLVYYLCITFIQDNLVLETFVMNVIYICVTLFFAPFIIIPVVLYSINGKLTDAFKLNIIMQASGNYVVQFMSYIIQYILILFLFTLLIYFLLLEMFGDHVSLLGLKCVLIVVSLFSVFLFSADLYGDVIPEIKVKKKINPKMRVKSKRKIS